jgi:FKBP-type peptidyl-prolyl cis-trans isomerase FkpA
MRYLIIFSLFFIFLSSCNKEDQAQIDDEIIRQYLEEHNIQATKHDSGLYYIITKEGSGDHPNINSTVEVKYKGYLTNGSVFDQTQGSNTITFPLKNLIKGWQIGIPLLKKGGEGTFFLPSELGYGNQNSGTIPANSVLIFEIVLVDF